MYEREVIGRLAERFPDLAPDLLALADRLVDLCALVVRHLYHPGFGQSFSLKNVVPALAPELTYDNLAVPDGRSAGLAFLNLVYTRDPARRRRLRRDLLRYCGRDALGMAAVKRWVLGEPPVQQNS
jgi:predicted RecB family nuclease